MWMLTRFDWTVIEQHLNEIKCIDHCSIALAWSLASISEPVELDSSKIQVLLLVTLSVACLVARWWKTMEMPRPVSLLLLHLLLLLLLLLVDADRSPYYNRQSPICFVSPFTFNPSQSSPESQAGAWLTLVQNPFKIHIFTFNCLIYFWDLFNMIDIIISFF